MSAEYTPERHGGVSVISASIGGLVKTSHHKYAGRRQEPLATGLRPLSRTQPACKLLTRHMALSKARRESVNVTNFVTNRP